MDVETTGLSPVTSDLLSLALVIFDSSKPVFEPKFQHEWRFYHELLKGEPYALHMNAELIAQAADPHNTRLGRVASELVDAFGSVTAPRITPAGKNFAGFDNAFLSTYVPKWQHLREVWFRHRTLDPGSMWVRYDDVAPPTLEECCKRAIVEYHVELAHTAEYDALVTARCIHAFLWHRGKHAD